ncbi:MAG: hypothetical protein ACFCUQ_15290 [Kiloniellales bacterium]
MDRRDSPSHGAGLAWPGADQETAAIEQAKASQTAIPAVEDAVLVSAAAGLTSLSEYDLFRAAWHQWHGVAAREQRLEPAFARYLRDRKAPGWVRHFARRVIRQANEGTLDPTGLHLEGYRRCEPLPDLGCRFTAEALGGLLLALLVILF